MSEEFWIRDAPTERGFNLRQFKDGNDVVCSVQESSAWREEGLIWLGCDDVRMQQFIPNGNPSWREVSEDELKQKFPNADYFSFNTRMHLEQSQVKALLPALEYFAEHGTLPKAELDVGEDSDD